MSRDDVIRSFAGKCAPELVEEIARATVKDLRQTLERKRVPGLSDWDRGILNIALAGLRLASCTAAGMSEARVREVRAHLAIEIAAAAQDLHRPPPPDDDPPPRRRAPRKRKRTAKGPAKVLPFKKGRPT